MDPLIYKVERGQPGLGDARYLGPPSEVASTYFSADKKTGVE